MHFDHVQTGSGPTQPSIQCVPEALSLGVKWLGHEGDHSLPLLQYAFTVWCLNNHRDWIF